MRLNIAIGATAGFLFAYQRSIGKNLAYIRHYFMRVLTNIEERFYGKTENKREQEMDMREMVEKAKRGEPLYGESQLSDYMQGVAARNSRYSGVFLYMLPWFNFVNHNQV